MLLLASGFASRAYAIEAAISAGFDYSNGDYGESTVTQVVSMPLTARVSFGAFSLRASIPYLTIRGPADVSETNGSTGSDSGSGSSGSGSGSSEGTSGSGSGEDGGNSGSGTSNSFAENRNVSGIGDTSLAATYSFETIGGSPLYFDLTGRVRLPTGNEREGLGVGATDYAALAEIGWDADAGGVFVSTGRRFLGSVPGKQRVNGWQRSVGTWINAGRKIVIGAYYDWRDAAIMGEHDVVSAQLYLVVKVNDTWRVEFHGGAGLSNSNADYNAGLLLTWKLSNGQ